MSCHAFFDLMVGSLLIRIKRGIRPPELFPRAALFCPLQPIAFQRNDRVCLCWTPCITEPAQSDQSAKIDHLTDIWLWPEARFFRSLRSEFAEPVGSRDSAVHEKVAAGNERAVRPHQKSGNGPHLIRCTTPPDRGQLDHASVSLAARTGQLVFGERCEDDAGADRVDPSLHACPTAPPRPSPATSSPRLEIW